MTLSTDGDEPYFDLDLDYDGDWDATNYTTQVPPIPREKTARYTISYGWSGRWTISVKAHNDGGTANITKIDYITVSDPIKTPPNADAIEAPVAEGTAPLAVTFTTKTTGFRPTFSYDWTNDGVIDATSYNPVRSKVYTAGTYTVRCKVSNAYGTDTVYKTITSHMKGDYNGNLAIDFADVSGLQAHIDNNGPYQEWMDMNSNGRLDFADVSALFNLI